MGLLELCLIAVGLSMDAFAVSVCKGLSVRTLKAKHAVICGLYFGGFQLLMPLIGFALGVRRQPCSFRSPLREPPFHLR